MAGNRRLIITLSAAAVLLLAGVLLLMFLPDTENKGADNGEIAQTPLESVYDDFIVTGGEKPVVTFMPQEGLQYSIIFDSESGSYILDTEEELFEGIKEELEATYAAATSLRRLLRIAENADDTQLTLFGFDNPEVTWRLQYEDGTVDSYILGSELPTGEGSYVRVQDSREIYNIRRTESDRLLKPVEELYDLSFTPLPPSTEDLPTWMYLTYVKLIKPGGDIIEVNKRDIDEQLELSLGASTFRMLVPFDTDCNDYMIQTIFMEPITYIQPQSLIATHPDDLSEYGLDNPAVLTVSMQLSEEESLSRTLFIGNPDINLGGRYVMIEGHDAVLLDTGCGYGFLNVDPGQLRNRIIWLHMINTVSSVEFMLDGVTRVLEMTHDGDELRGTLDGVELSTDNARRLYTAALNILVSGSIDAAIPPGVPAMYSITINLTGGGSETVDLYPLSDSQFLIAHEGVSADAFITRYELTQNLLSKFDVLDAGGDLSR